MNKLRTKIVFYLSAITLVMMLLILSVMCLLEFRSVQSRTLHYAEESFAQIRQILERNARDLEEVQEDYVELCMSNAQAIAYILENDPRILEEGELDELKKIAQLMQVDEIHVFDREGRIYFGTQPEYYGYTIESGEQISYFRPLLTDCSLFMVQDITPNTASGTLVQYSALWSEHEQFILQIGMYPDSVLKAREKNEISYIFSLLKADPGIELCAADHSTGKIAGSTCERFRGKTLEEIGLPPADELPLDTGFSAAVDGVSSYAVFTENGSMLIGRITGVDAMYDGMYATIRLFSIGLLLISVFMVILVARFIAHYVIEDIDRVNQDMRKITDGDLDVVVNIRGSQEFSELSRHINEMVYSLVESRNQIERERDMDLLTELYNRRGLENELRRLVSSGEDLGFYAVIMVDADRLKLINDLYGHEFGDAYLYSIGSYLRNAGTRKSVCSRQGGDEFVLFLYGYESWEVLQHALDTMRKNQNGHLITLKNGITAEMQFSMGFCIASGPLDYDAMLKTADIMMYADKKKRHCRDSSGPS